MSTRSTASTVKTHRPKLERCPRGSRRNKKTGVCVPNNARRDDGLPFFNVDMRPPKVRRRCVNGTRKNKKTGLCEPYHHVMRKTGDKKKAQDYVRQLREL